ncbi:MAG: hypothetical protein GXP04_14215 [Alphaproteobacteria bacterium]|nr:hypothetical protein [Alphaproteobacteria bacterium]
MDAKRKVAFAAHGPGLTTTVSVAADALASVNPNTDKTTRPVSIRDSDASSMPNVGAQAEG